MLCDLSYAFNWAELYHIFLSSSSLSSSRHHLTPLLSNEAHLDEQQLSDHAFLQKLYSEHSFQLVHPAHARYTQYDH